MARILELLEEALKTLGPKPPDSAKPAVKKAYSENISRVVSLAVAQELRHRGLEEARPAGADELGDSGAERRMAGGLGAKKVDVTWATAEAGLLLGISIKTINFRDATTKNFQKNLVNRRGDMLMEAVTLHRRFPYAVLVAFFFLDKDAAKDETPQRRSTFVNAHHRLKLFTGRDDPADRDEQFERFYLLLLGASPTEVSIQATLVGKPDEPVDLEDAMDDVLKLVAERNPDFYEFNKGKLRKAGVERAPKASKKSGKASPPVVSDDDDDESV
ncbi:hypothetical protein DSM104443_01165 [Usitatibacter rugosus]|uniref:Uncharacterized protein n=1 Tax=Usitatibacter rugosus TaxID=2732067 RepID=A0A6M4GSP1_9PROT|nr:hypothetical protein [Usitatibacter rugosus]QJR10112.1 hypothetical protein DSM104443_01165 [Usitatibacter rugosus]